MSQENVEVVRAIYGAWGRGDDRVALQLFDEDVEWFGPPDFSNSGVARGHEGVRRFARHVARHLDNYHFELRELIDSGDQVLAEGWQRGRGKGSGVEVSEEIFSVWTLRAGKVIRQRMFRDRGQALEGRRAVGVGAFCPVRNSYWRSA